MKWFTSEHVVEAFKKGELSRHQVVMGDAANLLI